MFEFYNSYDELVIIFSKDWKLVFANISALYHLNCLLDTVVGFNINKFISKDNVKFLKENLTNNNEIKATLNFTPGFLAECEIKFITPKYDEKYILIKTLLTDDATPEKMVQLTAADKIYDPSGIRDYHMKSNMCNVLNCIEMLKEQDDIKQNPEYLKALKTIYTGIAKNHTYYREIIHQYINKECRQPIVMRPVNPVKLSERIATNINNYFTMENINSHVKVNKVDSTKDVLSHYDSLAGVITGVVSVIAECAELEAEINIDFEFSKSDISLIISEKENNYDNLIDFLNNPLDVSQKEKWENTGIRSKYRKIINFMYVNNGEISYEKTDDKGFSIILTFTSVTDKLMDESVTYDENEVVKNIVKSFFVNIDI